VRRPTYDRADLTPGIVHLGVGGFHRAHQGIYLERLARRGVRDWAVVGVGLRSARDREALLAQGCSYSVLQRSMTSDNVDVVGTLLDYLHGARDPASVRTALASPLTKLVTLTVTGDGYGVDAAGELRLDPALRADLANPGMPRTAVGHLTEALRRRREAGTAPFTVLSCDNLARNGETARRAVVSFADLLDPALASWIERNVAFPASVVDRITPGADDSHRRLLAERFGIRDAGAVVCEDFSQWIVEDAFSDARPPLDAVGVELVADVAPYELKKKRLLNGSHSALGYLGYLLGYRRLDEAIGDPTLRRYAEGLMLAEVAPLLPGTGGTELHRYARSLLGRFANPRVADPLARLCARGSTKMPAYVLPSLNEAVELGRDHDRLTLAVAAWVRYLSGVDCAGRRIEVEDGLASQLGPLARRAASDVRPLLAVREVFGDLGADAGFAQRLQAVIVDLDRRGLAAALASASDERRVVAA
jgi:fructuronate reductase/mannitol 2-dehydrogenase